MIIVITGPTGVGKTKLSIELAKIYNGEVINADSMQVYKELDIGTAKASPKEREGIPHHLLDIKSLTEDYNIFAYQNDCRRQIEEIKFRHKIPIIVGGTGLYIKGALYNYQLAQEETKDNEFNELSNEEIYKELIAYNQDLNIDPNNRRRLVRYLNKKRKETLITNNQPYLLYQDAIFIGLTTDTENLYRIIDQRVDKMILAGLVDEVKNLHKKYPESRALNTAIGYKELIAFFDDKTTFNESIALIKQNSRNYAKRQYTFFNNQLNLKWFNVNYDNFNETINEVVNYIETISK